MYTHISRDGEKYLDEDLKEEHVLSDILKISFLFIIHNYSYVGDHSRSVFKIVEKKMFSLHFLRRCEKESLLIKVKNKFALM